MLKEGVRLDRVRGGTQKYRRVLENPYANHNTAKKVPLEGKNLRWKLIQIYHPEAVLQYQENFWCGLDMILYLSVKLKMIEHDWKFYFFLQTEISQHIAN